jgi:hypothetical protein
MSSSLLKSAAITRSFVARPNVWTAVRHVSQNSKAVTQADVVNVVNVDTVSGAPGKSSFTIDDGTIHKRQPQIDNEKDTITAQTNAWRFFCL